MRAGQRPVWIAASTHPEEEAIVLDLQRRLQARWPDLLLLWAPRHPERFRAVTQQAIDAGWRVATRKLTRLPDRGDAVFVIDTLGELMNFYGCAEVAFVGGSLQDIGGHNLLEPAAVGAAIVTGPHLHNFSDIARQLQAAGALRIGNDAEAVARDAGGPARRCRCTRGDGRGGARAGGAGARRAAAHAGPHRTRLARARQCVRQADRTSAA